MDIPAIQSQLRAETLRLRKIYGVGSGDVVISVRPDFVYVELRRSGFCGTGSHPTDLQTATQSAIADYNSEVDKRNSAMKMVPLGSGE